MDIGLFDNFEDDGQLSLFGLGEDVEDLWETYSGEKRSTGQSRGSKEAENAEKVESTEKSENTEKSESAEKPKITEKPESAEKPEITEKSESSGEIRSSGEAQDQLPSSGSAGIRIRRCSCCGKLLFVREEENCYLAACNACSVSYMQKI